MYFIMQNSCSLKEALHVDLILIDYLLSILVIDID